MFPGGICATSKIYAVELETAFWTLSSLQQPLK
jgi:hypothetical protein